MEFRRLTLKDSDSYFAFRMRALQNSPTAFLAVHEEEYSRGKAHLEETLAYEGDDKVIFGAVLDGQVVGSMGAYKEDRLKFIHKAQFWEMYVDKDHRGKGIAAQIFKLAVEHCRDKMGVQMARLSVESENHNARKLYESFGFKVWGTEPKAMKLGDNCFDVDHMMLLY